MQVILTKSVRKLGKVGEIVNVADGYGRNYLLPREVAIRATKDNITKFATIHKELENKNIESKKEADTIAEKIKGKHLYFIAQSAADGRLFGSVGPKALATELSKMAGTELNYNNVLLNSPIKFNGIYEVAISLHPEVAVNVLVVVAKSDSEAQDALKEYKEAGKKSTSDSLGTEVFSETEAN